ncbi:hypothetical protein ASE70_08125 [Sphingomonas sp. Leaf22]|uniref:ParB/RepB/Spo0J family partition protein n=1 Tax=Sphingomonas sp. Leaf22 TaxID=1735687 RepID=UPI0006F92BEE|nr:ParB N-terminal domain-containing protein [Sphingomonas sp. Leaf22]KQM76728.1 hypothetical protein ASE70_08125 [Sphingomonas sp. Leaf22]
MTAVTKTARPKLTIAGPKAAPVVIPSAPTPFPLRTLVRAAENVRRTRIDEDVQSLADDIRAHGLLQSLIGYTNDNSPTVHIVGGGRRLQALDRLMFDGAISGDFPVPVLIRDRELAVELSLAENIQQRTMSPVDEVFGFKALVDTGHHTVSSLAKRFGFSERLVQQRLRLAALAPEILDALADRTITLDAATAYAATQDRAFQQEIFLAESKRSHDGHSVRNIRHAIDAKGMRTTHPLYRFVGAGTYEARGGGYEDDLFRDTPIGAKVLAHPVLLLTIAAELLDERAAPLVEHLRAHKNLSPTIAGHVAVPGLVLASWGYTGPIPAPNGCVIINTANQESMWQRIRAEEIPVHVLVGISETGELMHWPKTVAVPKEQRETVALSTRQSSEPHNLVTAEQLAEIKRTRGIIRWSRRLALNALGGSPLFASTPLEGRAYWTGQDGESTSIGGVQGVLVPVNIFVAEPEIAAQRKAGERRHDEEEAEANRRQAERQAAEEAEQQRWEALYAMDPPAIVALDGAAWARDEDGRYGSTVDEAEPFDSWHQLLDVADSEGIEIGATFTTREAWEAALAAAKTAGATP